MKHALTVAMSAFLFLLSLPTENLSGQILGQLGDASPGEDVVSVGVVFGQMAPQTKFRDGGGFDSSGLVGATGNIWLHRYVGFQLNVFASKHGTLSASDGRASIVSGRDPKIWTYLGDVVARYPFGAQGAFAVSPYAALGGGWKSYTWGFDPAGGPGARGMDGAWSYAVGVDARFGGQSRIGLRGEFRDLRTSFDRFGENLTHEDRAFTASVLLNF